MVLFLSFAPLTFGGGAERWIAAVANSLAAKEEVMVIQAGREAANIYARLVIKRKFDERIKQPKFLFERKFLSWKAFLPFTREWKKTTAEFEKARVIYTRLELNELLMLRFFGGRNSINKTVIGLHANPVYNETPPSFLGRLHNLVYKSSAMRRILLQARAVHVLTPEQKLLMENTFGLGNTIQIANFLEENPGKIAKTNRNRLNIFFAGELTERKGADTLIDLIKQSPEKYVFKIAGDGPYKEALMRIPNKNYKYFGYLTHKRIGQIMSRSDVLFMPSRTESFSLVMLEALAYGLKVVCREKIAVNSLKIYLETGNGTTGEYKKILNKLFVEKQWRNYYEKRQATAREIKSTYAKKVILEQIEKKLFGPEKQAERMQNRDRLISLVENFIQGVKFHGWLKSTAVHYHYLVSQFSANKNAIKEYKFLGFKFKYSDIQSVRNLLFELFGFNSYFFKSANETPVILDIGANVGDSVLYFKWLYPKAKIFAFEPHPGAFKLLKENISGNDLQTVTAFNFGLSNREMTVPLYTTSEDLLGSSTTNTSRVKNQPVTSQSIKLKKISQMPEFKKIKRIDFIKIDIEGGEARLVDDLQSLLPITEKVVIEYHLVPDVADNSFDYIVNTLRKHDLEPNVSGFYRNTFNQATPYGSLLIAERKNT